MRIKHHHQAERELVLATHPSHRSQIERLARDLFELGRALQPVGSPLAATLDQTSKQIHAWLAQFNAPAPAEETAPPPPPKPKLPKSGRPHTATHTEVWNEGFRCWKWAVSDFYADISIANGQACTKTRATEAARKAKKEYLAASKDFSRREPVPSSDESVNV